MSAIFTTRRPATVADGVARLTRIACRRLDVGRPRGEVIAWLMSPSTAAAFGADAVDVVRALVTGGAR